MAGRIDRVNFLRGPVLRNQADPGEKEKLWQK